MTNIDFKQKVIWTYDNETDVVTFEFDSCERDAKEMFMKWVCFMNAIGYILDPEDMEKRWSGEE